MSTTRRSIPLQLERSVGQGVAPLQVTARGRAPRADVRRALEIQAVVRQARLEPHLPQRQVDLVEIDLAVGDRQRAIHAAASPACP